MAVERIEVQPHVFCHQSKRVDTSQKKTIAVYGSGASVVSRFYDGAFNNIRDRFPAIEFIGVDISPRPTINGLHLPWTDHFTAYLFNNAAQNTSGATIKIGDREITVDGVIVAVPPKDHLGIAKLWVPRVPTMVEKPIVMPGELDQVDQLTREHPDRLYAADCFMDSDAFQWVIKHKEEVFDKIGEVESISGRVVEPWPLEPGREWLLNPAINGGGLGMDMLPHPLAITSHLLKRLDIKYAMHVEQATLGNYGPILDHQAETYMCISGHAGNVSFSIDGGKGLDTLYSGITVKASKGSLDIMTGTEYYDPYVYLAPNEETSKLYIFLDGGKKYEGTLMDFMARVYGYNVDCGASVSDRLEASINGVRVVADAYRTAPETERYEEGGKPPFSESRPSGEISVFASPKQQRRMMQSINAPEED